jgi:hypothetical protein
VCDGFYVVMNCHRDSLPAKEAASRSASQHPDSRKRVNAGRLRELHDRPRGALGMIGIAADIGACRSRGWIVNSLPGFSWHQNVVRAD